jgi:hypothetical protein
MIPAHTPIPSAPRRIRAASAREWAAVVILAACLASCTGPVVPEPPPSPTQASNDPVSGPNSGILQKLPDGNWLVSAHVRARFDALARIYGQAKLPNGAPLFVPVIRPGDDFIPIPAPNPAGNWELNPHGMTDYLILSTLQREGFDPK